MFVPFVYFHVSGEIEEVEIFREKKPFVSEGACHQHFPYFDGEEKRNGDSETREKTI